MKKYLVESALLSQGLRSISNERLLEQWTNKETAIVWIRDGEIETGNIEFFCQFRNALKDSERINYTNFEEQVKTKKTGVLTASGTMKACEILKIPLAVSAGIGGIRKTGEESSCHDIIALIQSNTALLATSPKDMFDLTETFCVLKQNHIHILGNKKDTCDGYIFKKKPIKLTGQWNNHKLKGQMLFLNSIPEEMRINDDTILKTTLRCVDKEKISGGAYHPAVNSYLEKFTNGISAELQLYSVLENIKWAEQLLGDNNIE